jgi:2-polyprenyl-6-methoxyphenol hydroxylase-like FAD-dependent oxidoreductase
MDSNFKVIVVGGGPIGLIAPHALHRANIDFLLLECRCSIVEDEGASIVVYPQTVRVMHQLGFLESLLPLGTELDDQLLFTKDGITFNESPSYSKTRER